MSEPDVTFRDEPPNYSPPALEDKQPPVEPPLPPSGPTLTQDEKTWGMVCHLASLAGLVVPAGNVVGPIICWLMKKEKSAFVDRHGKESINFQLNLTMYILVSIVLGVLTLGIGFILTAALGVYGVVMPILAGLKANNGEDYQYPYVFRLLK